MVGASWQSGLDDRPQIFSHSYGSRALAFIMRHQVVRTIHGTRPFGASTGVSINEAIQSGAGLTERVVVLEERR